MGVLSAELLKLRRTLALWMVPIAPAVVVALQFLMLLRIPVSEAANRNGWLLLWTSTSNMWCVFMLPLFVALETALLAHLEHDARAWKHLFALPVPRVSVYASKLAVALGCVVTAGAVLILMNAAAGQLLRLLRPALGIGAAVPWASMLRDVALGSLASLSIVVAQLWIAVRWPGFTAALGVGIAGTFVALVAARSALGKYWLWSQPINAITGAGERLPLIIGVGGGVLLALLGAWSLSRRDVA